MNKNNDEAVLPIEEAKLEKFQLNWISNDVGAFLRDYIKRNTQNEFVDTWTESDVEAVKAFAQHLYNRISTIIKESTPTEEELYKMLRDPRYWRDHNIEYCRKIDEGFRKLYGGK